MATDAARTNTDLVIDIDMKLTRKEEYELKLHERPENFDYFGKTDECSLKTAKNVHCSIIDTVNLSTRKSDQTLKNGRILPSETTRVEPEKVDQKSVTWDLKKDQISMKNGQSVKNALFLPAYTSEIYPEKDERVKKEIVIKENGEKRRKRPPKRPNLTKKCPINVKGCIKRFLVKNSEKCEKLLLRTLQTKKENAVS